jgi:peptidyl-dipeptidase Dcp
MSMGKRIWAVAGASAAALLAAGCATTPAAAPGPVKAEAAAPAEVKPAAANPFFAASPLPFGAPQFDRYTPAFYREAMDQGMAAQREEIALIANSKAAPTFDNTILAMEQTGALLERVQLIFSNMTSANTNDDLQAIQRDYAPKLAAHNNAISLDPALFARVKAVYDQRAQLKLTPIQTRLLERRYLGFVRSGALLEGEKRTRFAAINERLASLSTKFSQNQLKDTREWVLELNGEADLAGLPESQRVAAAEAAKARGMEGKHVITLQRSSVEPFLKASSRRDLREKAYKAWALRGDNGDAEDNNATIAEIIRLRTERAQLLGYDTFADFQIADRMAKTPKAARDLLNRVWQPALKRALEERADMQKLVDAEKGGFKLQGWDWRYYAEKVRQQKFNISDAELKPYFSLDTMIAAQFYTANQLFGLTFEERTDLPVYHPDVRVWEVKDKAGKHVGLFYGDYIARPNKQSGAWMSSYRRQDGMEGTTPIVVNVMSVSKGQPTLLSYDDAETLFHEFGHALHGLLSKVEYPTLSGTSVATDFVEFPAQIYEHWLLTPEILNKFAKHYQTGAPIPAALVQKLEASRNFDQGFATVEFTGSAFVDLDLHELKTVPADFDARAFEKASLARINMPDEIVMRHRMPHFGHIFSGGYAAGYYSYMWSEILDADGFDAFKEKGNVFDPATAKKLYEYVYSAGNTRDWMEAYVGFRGREPSVDPLLRNRGFAPEAGKKTKKNPPAG